MPIGSIGTLAFSSDYLGFFLGYLRDNERTRTTRRGGWFISSDLARMDADGYVYIVGRADDCFKSKGILIAPPELENAILGLGRFEEACVFPVPDKETGNRIGAAVVLRGDVVGAPINAASLASALAGCVAPFKLPHLVRVLDELPKNVNGKVQRRQVASIVLDQAPLDAG